MGGVAMIAHGLASLVRGATSSEQPFVVGGVDLSRADLHRPFVVDFSVTPAAPLVTKQAAMLRLRHAFEELRRWQPMWLYKPEANIETGRFALYVAPIVRHPNQRHGSDPAPSAG